MSVLYVTVVGPRRQWSEEERIAVKSLFEDWIVRRRLPGKDVIESQKAQSPSLMQRSWRNIKDYIRNTFLK